MFKFIAKTLKKILNIFLISTLLIILIYLVYCLLALSYVILDSIYILDRTNAKSGFLLGVVAVYVYVILFSAGEHFIYSHAMDSGEIPHAEHTESIQGFRGSNTYHLERHVPITSTLLVRLARSLKLLLDWITVLFIHELVPTSFKLIYAAMIASYETTKYVVHTIYQEFKMYCFAIRLDFAAFRQSWGVQVLFNRPRSKPVE